MKRLFGTPKVEAPAAPAPSLTDTSARMDTRIQDLDQKIAKCEEDIRRYMAPEKRGTQKQLAMQTLKRKKMYEQQKEQLLGTQFNVDCLAGAQEQAEITTMTVEAMKAGHADLKQRMGQFGKITDVERLMDDMADLHADIGEINDVLATSYAVPDGFDEASCEAEFAALEEEMALSKMTGVSQSANTERPSYLPAAQPQAVPVGAGDLEGSGDGGPGGGAPGGYGGGGGGGGGSGGLRLPA